MRVSCHEGLDEPPTEASAIVWTGDTTEYTDLSSNAVHRAGGAITSIDATVHVYGEASSFGGAPVPDPVDVHGLHTVASEFSSGDDLLSELRLSGDGDVLGVGFCPTDTGSGSLPPALRIGITGTTERGPFSSELFVPRCGRSRL